MHIDVRNEWTFEALKVKAVYVDGVLQTRVVAFDTDEGWVELLSTPAIDVLDAYVDVETGQRYMERRPPRRYGVVTVELHSEAELRAREVRLTEAVEEIAQRDAWS